LLPLMGSATTDGATSKRKVGHKCHIFRKPYNSTPCRCNNDSLARIGNPVNPHWSLDELNRGEMSPFATHVMPLPKTGDDLPTRLQQACGTLPNQLIAPARSRCSQSRPPGGIRAAENGYPIIIVRDAAKSVPRTRQNGVVKAAQPAQPDHWHTSD